MPRFFFKARIFQRGYYWFVRVDMGDADTWESDALDSEAEAEAMLAGIQERANAA